MEDAEKAFFILLDNEKRNVFLSENKLDLERNFGYLTLVICSISLICGENILGYFN